MPEAKTESKPKNKPLVAPGAGSLEDQTKKLLDEQDKVMVMLYQVPKGSSDEPLPPVPVSINGYVYQLERGVKLNVPESVADILAESGHA